MTRRQAEKLVSVLRAMQSSTEYDFGIATAIDELEAELIPAPYCLHAGKIVDNVCQACGRYLPPRPKRRRR